MSTSVASKHNQQLKFSQTEFIQLIISDQNDW